MMKTKNLQTLTVIITLVVGLWACGGSSDKYLDINDSHMPSAGLSTDPEGSDLLSSSTNHSAKTEDTHPKIDSLKGAAFVKPPQINHFGAVSIGYPVETPAGRAGLEPKVSLGYSSSSGDGLMGIGWNMSSGLGVISRTTQNGQLYYDERDIFTYNGARMVKVSGSSGSEDGTYRLEIESDFSRFELSGSANGGVWRVFDSSGRITLYGEDASSRIYRPDDTTRTYSWYYSQGLDLNGNYMQAIYDASDYEEKHILYLKEIRYTGNVFEGMSARQYVRFHLKDRDDFYVSKAPGFIMKMDRLLDYIEVGWDDPYGSNNTELWRYTLVYEISTDSNRSILKTVKSTRTTTEPEFAYQDAVHNFTWRVINNPDYGDPEVNPETTKYFEGDFNGDGISDMVFFNPENGYWKAAEGRRDGGYNFKTYGNKFKGYDNPTKIQFFKGNVTGDYNGDGRSDIAFYLPETREFWVAEHNGKTFDFKVYGKNTLVDIDIFKCEWFPGDFDGNGLSDSVLYNEPTGEWILMRNTGGGFEFIKFSRAFQNLFRSDYSSTSSPLGSASTSDTSAQGKDRDRVYFLSGDYNGDGRTDISIYDSRDGKWWVAENYRDDTLGFRLEWKLYKVFTAPEMALFGNDRFSGDFNGDGFSDFLLFNRATGEWIIGETGNGTINFRIYSKVPQFKDITRWLQGDFNGDGRTDIGFYSKTDGNFWIGEATPDGFRYRIYNNMSYGPNRDVLASAPLPMDEVTVASDKSAVNYDASTSIVDYQYDGNAHTGRGERVFTGNFIGVVPGMLIYNRKDYSFSYKASGSGSDPAPVPVSVDIEASNRKILNDGKPINYGGSDGILYYEKASSGHSINIIQNYNGAWQNTAIAAFNDSKMTGFNINESLLLADSFMSDGVKYALALDDLSGDPKFYLLNGSAASAISITGDVGFGHIFSSGPSAADRAKRKQYLFFSGNFDSDAAGRADILMVDMSDSTHRYYLGVFSGSTVNFKALTGSNANFITAGYNSQYRVTGNRLVYATADGTTKFHQLTIGQTGTVAAVHTSALNSDASFKGDFDYNGNPVVFTPDGARRYIIANGAIDSQNPGYTPASVSRQDLYQKIYPFQWIQGDYNGDGKTDIGIFHLKERYWYFANTTGTVPDLLQRVSNGMGGTYEMSYINSTTCDSTGDDGIPHLPMNYKVCDRLTVSDGQGRDVTTKYEYAKGYAFSAFINDKKETDYFGFGEFRVIDAYGAVNASLYYNIPYDDFRKNRALAGAIKESRVIGTDQELYTRSVYEYDLHIISQTSGVTSFLVDPAKVCKYVANTATKDLQLVETKEVHTELLPNRYVIKARSEKAIDHYQDAVHSPETIENTSEYEYTEATNEMRVYRKRSFLGSAYEITNIYAYDTRGNLLSETLRYTGSGLTAAGDRVMEYAYDAYGNRIRKTNSSDSPSRITETSFDDRLHQFTVEERAITDSGNLVTRYDINYASAFGGINIKTDPNMNCTYYEYDPYGRLLKVQADTDSGKLATTGYAYMDTFPLGARAVNYTGGSDMNSESCVFFDGTGRVIHTIMSSEDVSGRRYVKSGLVEYDAAGRVIRKSQPSYASDSEMGSFSPNKSVKNPTITEYDPVGRVKKVTLPKANSTEPETFIITAYNDPFETVETHSIGRSKRTVKNSRGQVLYIDDSGTGDDGSAASAKMGFAYNLTGKRVKKMDLNSAGMDLTTPPGPPLVMGGKDTSGNNVAYWWYNGLGDLVASSDPDLGCNLFVRNGFGDVMSSTDAKNQTTTMSYDRLGRMVQKTLPGSEGAVYYYYDSLAGSDNARGRLVAVDDPSQRKEISYDKLGRVKREVRRFKGLGVREQGLDTDYETLFEHDLLGRQTKITYPREPLGGNRASATYSYASAGVKRITADYGTGAKDIISSVDYNEFGQMSMLTRGNGVTTNYDYDNKRRLTNLVSTVNANGSFSSLQDVRYTFNIQDSITATENTPDSGTDGVFASTIRYNYKYDGLNRLYHATGFYEKTSSFGTTETQKFELGYAYSANGNLTQKNIIDPDSHAVQDSWSYIYSNHAVTGIVTTKSGSRFDMQYDASGNMIYQHDAEKGLTKQMAYDSNNRIQYVTNPTTGEKAGEYWYDDQGFRVRKISRRLENGDQVDNEILYPNMYMGMELHTNGYEVVNNIYMNGLRVAAMIPNGGAMYFLTDQVDSVKVVVNDAGKAVTRYEYKPYGEAWFTEGDEDFAPKYNSQELDKETNFYFYNARYYDPEICRFVTADNQIDNEFDTQGWNRFSYVKGNPVVYKDPTGHNSFRDDLESLGNLGNLVGGLASIAANKITEPIKEKFNEVAQKAKGSIDKIRASSKTADSVFNGVEKAAGWIDKNKGAIAQTAAGVTEIIAGASLTASSIGGGLTASLASGGTLAVPAGAAAAVGAAAGITAAKLGIDNLVQGISRMKAVDNSKGGGGSGNIERGGNVEPKVLQSGGNKIKSSTAKDLGLTKQEAKSAIEGLKKDSGLRNDNHQQILDNGDIRNSKTKEILGNLYDYVKSGK